MMADTPRIRLIARVACDVGGRSLAPGDAFTTSPVEAAALVYQGRARFAPTPPSRRRERRPGYRRRDLTAEGT